MDKKRKAISDKEMLTLRLGALFESQTAKTMFNNFINSH